MSLDAFFVESGVPAPSPLVYGGPWRWRATPQGPVAYERQCTRCKAWKKAAELWREAGGSRGYKSQCKTCHPLGPPEEFDDT